MSAGRVTISKDHDMIENARIIRAAVDMAAVRDKIFNQDDGSYERQDDDGNNERQDDDDSNNDEYKYL